LSGLALVLGILLVLTRTLISPAIALIEGSLACIEVTDRLSPDFKTLNVIGITVARSGTFAEDDMLILVETFLEELDCFILPSRVVDRFEGALVVVSLEVNKLDEKSLTGFSIGVIELTIFVEDFAVVDLDAILVFTEVGPGNTFEIVVEVIVRGTLVEIISRPRRELILVGEVVGSLS